MLREIPRVFAASIAIATVTGPASTKGRMTAARAAAMAQSSGEAASQWEENAIEISADCIPPIRCSVY
jgi:hypothetical protein